MLLPTNQVFVHILLGVEHEEALLSNSMRSLLCHHISGILKNNDSHSYRVGGLHDHMHIACTLPTAMTQIELVELLKSSVCRWFESNGLNAYSKVWRQMEHGIFSFAHSHLPAVLCYIDVQKDHHKNITFSEELKRFCYRHDEPYLKF